MTLRHFTVQREQFAVPLLKAALLAAALLTSVATDAFADGSISGRVTGSNAPGGLQGTKIQVFNLNSLILLSCLMKRHSKTKAISLRLFIINKLRILLPVILKKAKEAEVKQ